MKKADKKAELLKRLREELDRRTQIENEAIHLIGENRIEKAQEILDSIDDSILKEIEQELDRLDMENGENAKVNLSEEAYQHFGSRRREKMPEHSNTFKSSDGTVEVEIKIRAECSTSEDLRKTLSFIGSSSRKFYMQTAEKFNSVH